MNRTAWSLVSIEARADEASIAVQRTDGKIVAVDVVPAGLTLIDLFRDWSTYAPKLKAFDPAGAKEIANAKIVAPLQYPSNLVCIGANYNSHRREMGTTPNTSQQRVFMFLKPPVTTIIGPGDDILIRSEADNVDWEAEIAIVIGKPGRQIQRADAMSHVAAYTLVNDISARGAFQIPSAGHSALEWDWMAVKAQDTFCPMGPTIVPSWMIEDPADIDFELHLNGVLKQKGNTGDMTVDIPGLVVAVSELMTLNPGDVIATGTPAGVGGGQGVYFKEGDEVVVSCPLIGVLSNRVRLLKAAAA